MNRRRFLVLAACAALPQPAAASEGWQGRAMGADVTLRLRGASPAQARSFFSECARLLAHVDHLFSLHRESDLARLNRIGHLRFPDPGLVELMALADRLHHATGGMFDPSVQPLWLARAAGADEVPARRLAGWQDVYRSEGEIRLTRPGMALTFNGLAQGWAADRLASAAARHDLTDLLIDCGELRAQGRWQAGLADAGGRVHRRITLQDRALATSSPAGTLIGPRNLAHIIAPDGGAAQWDTISVSAPEAAVADGLSTALCLLDRPAAARALAQFPGARLEFSLAFAGNAPTLDLHQ